MVDVVGVWMSFMLLPCVRLLVRAVVAGVGAVGVVVDVVAFDVCVNGVGVVVAVMVAGVVDVVVVVVDVVVVDVAVEFVGCALRMLL